MLITNKTNGQRTIGAGVQIKFNKKLNSKTEER
jgi:hypothetical protein